MHLDFAQRFFHLIQLVPDASVNDFVLYYQNHAADDIWVDGLAMGEPARLMGYRVLIAEDMPDIADDALAIAFGDFGAGYTVAERPDLRVLRDPFSAKPHVLFYATKIVFPVSIQAPDRRGRPT